jgi:uncharacterized RDD family membrane protein YckC
MANGKPRPTSRKQSVRTVTFIGFSRRTIAALIDFLFITFIGFLVSFLLGFLGLFVSMFTAEESQYLQGIIALSFLLVSVLYYLISWTRSGSTMGQMVVGARVVGTDGAKLRWGKAILRYLGYLVSALVFALGFVWVIFDQKRQGWHDKIAKTYVIMADDSFSPNEQVTFKVGDPGTHWGWVIVYVLLILAIPIGAVSGFIVFGPAVSRFIADILSGIAR